MPRTSRQVPAPLPAAPRQQSKKMRPFVSKKLHIHVDGPEPTSPVGPVPSDDVTSTTDPRAAGSLPEPPGTSQTPSMPSTPTPTSTDMSALTAGATDSQATGPAGRDGDEHVTTRIVSDKPPREIRGTGARGGSMTDPPPPRAALGRSAVSALWALALPATAISTPAAYDGRDGVPDGVQMAQVRPLRGKPPIRTRGGASGSVADRC